MGQEILKCDDLRCELMADDFFSHSHGRTNQSRFNNVIADVIDAYPEAILAGAMAAAKYIRHPVEPRITFDVDFLLPESDFEDFLADEIPDPRRERLESHFADSDSAMHSLQHKHTGIYVDFMSVQSKPLKKKLIRHILSNRMETTNMLRVGDKEVDILKPETLIAVKLHRYHKNPKTEKGLSDRLDIMKILKTFYANCVELDFSFIHEFANKEEMRRFDHITGDLGNEMTCPEESIH